MKKTFRRNLIIGFSISLLLLILSSAASFISISNLLSSADRVNHTHRVITDLETVSAKLVETETRQRGFLLTGEEEFIRSLQQLISEIGSGMSKVEQLTLDNPGQQSRVKLLKEAIDKRIDILNEGIAYKKQNKEIDHPTLMDGKQYMDSARKLINNMEDAEQSLLVTRTESMQQFANYTPVLIVVAAILSIIITIVFYLRISNDLKRRSRLQRELENKDREIKRRIEIIKDVADKISDGNYQVRVTDEGKDGLGNLSYSLNKMAKSLEYSFGLLSDKEWLQAAVAGLNQQMQGEQEVEQLAGNIINFVAEKTNSKVGALYLLTPSGSLSLASGFALAAGAPKEIKIGEGIVGQCAKNRKEILAQHIASEHFAISFASGELKASTVIAIPIVHEGILKGVMELGALEEYAKNERLFLTAVSEEAGIVITTAQNRRILQELLEETQSQSEELQVQHSELENINEELKSQSQKLQVSEEELKVQQEELMQTNQELEERTTLLEEKNQMIEEKNQEIQLKARELAITGKYKSEFLANMSHELRTPLNSILLLSRLLTENNNNNLSGDQIEYAHVIQSSGHGLLALIDEILDLSKIESGKMQMEYAVVPIKTIMDDIRSLFVPLAQEKKIGFDIQLGSDAPADFETDKLRLEQVIKNLVSNALKFTSQGEVILTISKRPNEPGTLMFAVKDTGIGIASEKQKLIFEAFQQADGSTRRQYGGTGLGLSISRELARLLGGHIELISEPGKGSQFTFFVPVVRPERLEDGTLVYEADRPDETGEFIPDNSARLLKEEQQRYASEILPSGIPDDRNDIAAGDKVILIIEDDTNFAKTLLDFARQRGYKAVVAVQGDEGAALARLTRPVGILLDIMLPVKDGWEVMKELKDDPKTKHIPVHIMSSHEVKNKSISSGAVDFINKPLAFEKMQEVFLRIEEVLNRDLKKVLIVEENSKHAQALSYFLENFNISSAIKSNVNDAIGALQKKETTCVILDTGVVFEKSSGALDQVKKTPGLETLPIIIFTGRNLSKSEEIRIKQYADSIVFKTAHSYQRILDEVTLFLHLVEENKTAGAAENYRKLGGLNEVLKNKKVLIADDDVRNIFSLTRALENFGMNVLSATDGREALQQLKEHPSLDIILMDMMMPEMDGYETMKRIRTIQGYSNLPIIAVTAKAMSGDREKCISSGASDYITKPVDTDQLLSLLRVWLYDRT